jgi:hypothetical protein
MNGLPGNYCQHNKTSVQHNLTHKSAMRKGLEIYTLYACLNAKFKIQKFKYQLQKDLGF